MRPIQRRTTTRTAAVPLLLALLMPIGPTATPARATAPTVEAAAPISWHECEDRLLRRFHGTCGELTVPLDPAAPSGPTISLAVSRILHTREPYRGVMFSNPGGPGGSGTYLAAAGQFVPRGVGKTYDWYGLDPRGVGASSPALTCDGHYDDWDRPPYVPTSTAVEKSWRRRTEGYAVDCGRSAAAALLPHMRTTDNVADLEALRVAIGAERVGFLGVSYGTYLAQVYATLHPDRVDKLLLDGVVDPAKAFYRANQAQSRAFETSIRKFFGWVAEHDGVLHLGRSRAAVATAYYRLRQQLTRDPAGRVGPDELNDAVENAVYTVGAWPDVASALAGLARHGDPSGIAALYRDSHPVGPGADNQYAVYLATLCTDAPWPERWKSWEKDSRRLHRRAPFETWSNTWFNAPCRTWPAPAAPRIEVDGTGFTGPVLLLNETYDGATPFAFALAVRRLFPTSALVEGVGGSTHAIGLSGVRCVDRTITKFLASGALPNRRHGNRADLRCPGIPPPSVR